MPTSFEVVSNLLPLHLPPHLTTITPPLFDPPLRPPMPPPAAPKTSKNKKKGGKPKKTPAKMSKEIPQLIKASSELSSTTIAQLTLIGNAGGPPTGEGVCGKPACKPAVLKEVVPLMDRFQSAKRKTGKENPLYVPSYNSSNSSHSPRQNHKETEDLTWLC
jgi:hypothetical protein